MQKLEVSAAPFFAVATVLGLVLALPSPLVSSTASVLKPAPITEDFHPVLPCNNRTTVGEEGCGERRTLAADKQLNADIDLVFKQLASVRAKRDFIAAQSAWLRYRKADCQSQSDVYQGGTEQAVAFVYCLPAVDKLRRQGLKAFYASLTAGRAKAPKFP